MTERHYAHLAPNYVADTIRASFPRLTETTLANVVAIGRPRKNANRTGDDGVVRKASQPLVPYKAREWTALE
jgi:hypothetical protein